VPSTADPYFAEWKENRKKLLDLFRKTKEKDLMNLPSIKSSAIDICGCFPIKWFSFLLHADSTP